MRDDLFLSAHAELRSALAHPRAGRLRDEREVLAELPRDLPEGVGVVEFEDAVRGGQQGGCSREVGESPITAAPATTIDDGMRIGIARESWSCETRVAATPSAARTLVEAGHRVVVEQDAGAASGFTDTAYIQAGAEIAPTAEELYARADLAWKVMAPNEHERRLLRAGTTVAAWWHRASPPEGVTALPLDAHAPTRASMSVIAGRRAVEEASVLLQHHHGGRGLLLGGLPGVFPAVVVVLGAGMAGRAAAALAAAVGARVIVLDADLGALGALHLPGATTLLASAHHVERAIVDADVIVGAVRGPAGPRVLSRAHLALLQPGTVLVDLAVADGGVFESTPTTTLEAPGVLVDGVVHVGVPNLAGGVGRTASLALSQASVATILAAAG